MQHLLKSHLTTNPNKIIKLQKLLYKFYVTYVLTYLIHTFKTFKYKWNVLKLYKNIREINEGLPCIL